MVCLWVWTECVQHLFQHYVQFNQIKDAWVLHTKCSINFKWTEFKWTTNTKLIDKMKPQTLSFIFNRAQIKANELNWCYIEKLERSVYLFSYDVWKPFRFNLRGSRRIWCKVKCAFMLFIENEYELLILFIWKPSTMCKFYIYL